MKRFVAYTATASIVVGVDVPDATPAADVNGVARDLAEEAFQDVSASLCHHCAGRMDVGDFEQDEDEGGVWSA